MAHIAQARRKRRPNRKGTRRYVPFAVANKTISRRRTRTKSLPPKRKSQRKATMSSHPSFSKATVPGVEYIDSDVLASRAGGQSKSSTSKAIVPRVEYIDSEVLTSFSKATVPGTLEYIDSDVLAPREQTDEKKTAYETQK
jgi:hypothetical protein